MQKIFNISLQSFYPYPPFANRAFFGGVDKVYLIAFKIPLVNKYYCLWIRFDE